MYIKKVERNGRLTWACFFNTCDLALDRMYFYIALSKARLDVPFRNIHSMEMAIAAKQCFKERQTKTMEQEWAR